MNIYHISDIVEPFTFTNVQPRSDPIRALKSRNVATYRRLDSRPSQLRHARVVKLPSGVILTPIPGQEPSVLKDFVFRSYYVSSLKLKLIKLKEPPSVRLSLIGQNQNLFVVFRGRWSSTASLLLPSDRLDWSKSI